MNKSLEKTDIENDPDQEVEEAIDEEEYEEVDYDEQVKYTIKHNIRLYLPYVNVEIHSKTANPLLNSKSFPYPTKISTIFSYHLLKKTDSRKYFPRMLHSVKKESKYWQKA